MAKPTQDHLATAVAAFNQNVATLRRLRGLENDSELWRLMNKKVDGAPARKTVNNALQDRHDARLSTYMRPWQKHWTARFGFCLSLGCRTLTCRARIESG